MFFKLALKNIRRSIKDYAIYFFTLVLGVAIFYVFNSLESQSVMLDVTERVKDLLKLMNVVLGVVSVFVSVILGALIIYASRFLIKRRSKEFGIYLTLGMSKRKISLILLIETLLIGLFSLAIGLGLGVLASQFTSIIVANMFDANLTHFQFVFSLSAFLKTILYFGIIYLIVMIFNTIVVNRQKLINLLSHGRRNEVIKNKNLWLCTAVFILSAAMLGYAYYMVTAGLESLMLNSDGPEILLVPIIMGTVSTFLLFWSLSGILLRIFMSFKQIYYHKLNSFVLRQFSSKINTTVASMSVICLMLFVTICVLSSALSINRTLHQNIERTLPMDVQITGFGNRAVDIKEIYQSEDINLDNILKDVVSYKTYRLESVVSSAEFEEYNATGDAAITVNHDEDGSIINTEYSIMETYIHVSDYNRLTEAFQLPKVELADDEYAILANFQQIVEIRNDMLKHGRVVRIAGKTYSPKYDKCIDGTISLEAGKTNSGIFILPDSAQLEPKEGRSNSYTKQVLLGNYRDPAKAKQNEETLYTLHNRFFTDPHPEDDHSIGSVSESYDLYYYNVDTKQDIIDNSVGTSALVTFVGLYVGIIFLISSAAVLALKELSESSDNRDKYTILRKIGTSNRLLNRALFWQVFIFFLFPLLIAALHSIFGLMFCNFLLSTLGGINIAHVLPGVVAILLIIYGGYFLITYFCSKNIIREHRA